MHSEKRKKPGEASVGEDVQVRIGRNLKDFYQGVVSEPVPDKLRSLVEDLKKRESGEKTSRGA